MTFLLIWILLGLCTALYMQRKDKTTFTAGTLPENVGRFLLTVLVIWPFFALIALCVWFLGSVIDWIFNPSLARQRRAANRVQREIQAEYARELKARGQI